MSHQTATDTMAQSDVGTELVTINSCLSEFEDEEKKPEIVPNPQENHIFPDVVFRKESDPLLGGQELLEGACNTDNTLHGESCFIIIIIYTIYSSPIFVSSFHSVFF